MLLQALQTAAAYALDRLVGDPARLPHPVMLMGKAVAWLERKLCRQAHGKTAARLSGLLLPIVLAGGSYIAVWLMLALLGRIHPLLQWAAGAWMISTTIAAKGLAEAGRSVLQPLGKGDLAAARSALAMIVGRDTEHLDEAEISRGAVETVAENIVDAVVAPLFYAFIAGPPLAMAYRAINTLDSMVGYKNEKYEHFGWASARLDDLANYVPARIAGLLLVLVSRTCGLDGKRAWRMMLRDARKHPSPNSGWTEAGAAGAIGIRLGGLNTYQGRPSMRAYLGDALRPIEANDIRLSVRLMTATSTAAAILGTLLLIIVNFRG